VLNQNDILALRKGFLKDLWNYELNAIKDYDFEIHKYENAHL